MIFHKIQKDIHSWHRWFAWHPVCLNGTDGAYVWLEFVERKRIYAWDDYWFYRFA